MKADLHIVTIAEHESAPLPDGAIVLGGDATHVAFALPAEPEEPHRGKKGDK